MAPARACAELYITVVISARVSLVTRALAATIQGLASWAHVWLTPYSACSAYFFSWNSVFLSQQFSQNSVF